MGSKIVHGSVAGNNDFLRRRSVAAHFLPSGFKFGNLEKEVPIKFAQKYDLKFRFIDYLDDKFNELNRCDRESEFKPKSVTTSKSKNKYFLFKDRIKNALSKLNQKNK